MCAIVQSRWMALERGQVRLLGARRKHVLKFIVLGVLQGLETTEFTNLLAMKIEREDFPIWHQDR